MTKSKPSGPARPADPKQPGPEQHPAEQSNPPPAPADLPGANRGAIPLS